VNGSLKFLSKIFGRCPKITAKNKYKPKLKYSSQLVTKVSRIILWNGRKLTQQTEHKTELERPKYTLNGKSEPPKKHWKIKKIRGRLTKTSDCTGISQFTALECFCSL